MKRYLAKLTSVAATVSILASMSLPALAANETQDHYVDVTADVTPSLAFQIVAAYDILTPTSTCPLGTLSLGNVNQCQYRLRIATNHTGGFFADLRATTALVNGAIQIADIGVSGTVTAGTEGYGLAIAPSSNGGYVSPGVYTAQNVVNGAYATGDNTVPTVTSTSVITYTQPFDGYNGGATWATSTTNLITHKAAINFSTPAGNYTQRVFWEVTATP